MGHPDLHGSWALSVEVDLWPSDVRPLACGDPPPAVKRLSKPGFRVPSLGFRVLGLGFRV